MIKQLDSDSLRMLKAFQKKRVMHLKLQDVVGQLMQIEYPSFSGKIVTLVGPTGVGKSTALEHLEAVMMERHREEMMRDPSCIPVIRLSLQTGITGDFNWKDTFIRMLEAFNEPLIKKKIITKHYVELDGEVVTNLSRLVGPELRRAVRNCALSRNTKIMLLDEASSLFTASSGQSYLLQFELVKSLVNEIHSRIVLCGAYDLLKIEDFNGQLIRRTRIVHFDSYHREELTKQNKYGDGFKDTVMSLLNAIPIEKEAGLAANFDYFLMLSLGCVGNLKDWFARAFEAALHMEEPIFNREILTKTELSKRNLIKMLNETKLGEARMKDISIEALAKEMGYDETPTLNPKKNKPSTLPNEAKKKSVTVSGVARRSPSRDAVGEKS